MLDIIIFNSKLNLDTSTNLLLTCKESYFSIIQNIPGSFYEEWYEYFPDIVKCFEEFTHKTFYYLIDEPDIKLTKLFKILEQLSDINNGYIHSYKTILRPLLTNELFISFKNPRTLIFLAMLYQHSLNYSNHYIRDYFEFFMSNYTCQKDINKNIMDYIGHWFKFIIIPDQNLNFSYKYILRIKLGKQERKIIYSIMHRRHANIHAVNFGIVNPKIKT